MKIETLAIVGVGLIGGSIGLAVKRRRLARHVIGFDRATSHLGVAVSRGAIDVALLDLAAAVSQADVVVFCTPDDQIVEHVLRAAPSCKPGALLTDVGSTKGAIVMGIGRQLPEGVHFVGSHPLAGSEKRGPEFANADLFEGRLTVVTEAAHRYVPGGKEARKPAREAVTRICDFWSDLGSEVRKMGCDEHDEALARTGHLPHLVASALAGTLRLELFDLATSGFRETTRIAAGDPSMWNGIFMQNTGPILAALGSLNKRLGQFRDALKNKDQEALGKLLAEGKKVRDALGS